MATDHRAELARIHRFDQLIRYLRDEMGWPIASDDFEELTFDYTAEELGINAESAAKIQEIKRLRPLSAQQPWGIFFVKFEPKNLPVVALRRILSQVALKKRASANAADRAGWAADDLLFVSNYGQDGERKISFAHFARPSSRDDLPTLKVLGWDNQDTPLHLDAIAKELTENLAWPQDENDADAWRQRWRSAFTLGHREVITTAERLSIRLAELAGAIRDRIRSAIAIESPQGPLTRLMRAFQESLVTDLDAEGFADMYAQTISYGLLSSRIADPTKKTADDFAAHMRTSPFLRELMQTFLKAGGRKGKSDGAGIDFDELGVADVVELLDGANMEAVLRDFGDRNRQEDPVIHFFEGFLQAYDRRIRKDRGVFYTPQPVVSYIVRGVHELLQTEFDLADGLADTTTWGEMLKKYSSLKLPPLTDEPGETRTISPGEPFVQILDPATGTATFLVEVIDFIYRTLAAKWKAKRLTDAQQRDAWNDYVPKHLLPRLHAFELMMAPYAIAHMKIGLKLAETGYGFRTEERARVYLTNALETWVHQLPLIGFDALAHEASAVNEIKKNKRFTVVLGNPPYSSVSQNMSGPLIELVNQYLELPDGPMREKSNRNHLQDDYVKFIRLSQATIQASRVGIVAMITNNSYLTGAWYRGMRYQLIKCFPLINILNLHGGKGFIRSVASNDENVFDIMQSVAISLFVAPPLSANKINFDECIGTRQQKYQHLLTKHFKFPVELIPTASNHWLFSPISTDVQPEWAAGVSVENIFIEWGAGVKTNRNGLAIAKTPAQLESQIKDFSNVSLSDTEIEAKYEFSSNYAWETGTARKKFMLDGWNAALVTPYLFRPFDTRYIYWHPTIVFNMRGDKMEAFRSASPPVALLFSRTTIKDYYTNFFVSRLIADHDCLEKTKVAVLTTAPASRAGGFDFEEQPASNISRDFVKLVAARLRPELELNGLPASPTLEDIFHYIYAVFYSVGYRRRYSEFLKIDFPRVPVTSNLQVFQRLVWLGGELTKLHLLESDRLVQSMTTLIGNRPFVEKITWSQDTVWLNKAKTNGFQGVSKEIWDFHIGGYQVCEKWLKDRKGQILTKDDIAHYQKIIVALSETIVIMGEIDEVIDQHGGWPDAFQTY